MTWNAAQLGQPRFAGVADLIAKLRAAHAGDDWPSIDTIQRCFAADFAIAGVTLVQADKRKPRRARDGAIDPSSLYEVRIVETGEIATRPRNAHDLLNALAWAAFPHSKRALTAELARIQRERATARHTLPGARSPEHDRLALVDEGGLVRASGALWIFGHAIYEHAYRGELAVRASLVDLDVAAHAPAATRMPLASLAPIAPRTNATTRAGVDRALAAVLADPARLAVAMQRGPGVAIDDALLAVVDHTA